MESIRKRSPGKTLSPPRKRTVLVIDALPLIREGVARLIDLQLDLQVAAVAGDVEDAQRFLKEHQPDVVLVDPGVPEGEVGAVLSKLQRGTFRPPLVVHSLHATYAYLLACLRAGAEGYVRKDSGAADLLEALRTVISGATYVPPFSPSPPPRRIDPPRPIPGLPGISHREFAVFERLGRGLKPAAIASDLGIQLRTVDAHRSNIRTKLKLPDFAALTVHAVRWVEAKKKHSV